jgi:hypothetical protein
MMKKVCPETSPTACTWPVQHIYDDVYDKKSWSKHFFYRLYMVHTAYIYDENSWSIDFPYGL